MKLQYLFFISTFILFSCGKMKETTSDKIQKTQTDIKSLLKEVTPKIENCVQIKNSINVQGQALTPQQIETVSKIEALKQLFEQWKKGYEKRKVIRFKDEEAHLDFFKNLKKELEIIDKKTDELKID